MTCEISRRWFFALVGLAAIPAVAFCAIGFVPLARTGLLMRGQVVGRDFAHIWTAARLAAQAGASDVYRPAAFQAAIDAMFARKLGLATFPYPPAALPLIAWTAALPYALALAAWSLAGLAALTAAAWPARRPAALSKDALAYRAALVLSPAVFLCLEGGQTGLFIGAMTLGALRLADRRPALAGALIGLAAIKPHLVMLFPVALVAAGRWRALAAAAASALTLALASLALYGPEPWVTWLTAEVPYQSGLYAHAAGGWLAFTTSPFGFARSLAPLGAAAVFQAAVTLAATVAVWRRFRKLDPAGAGPDDWVVLLAASLAASPYSFGYDAAGLTGAVLILFSRPDAAATPLGLRVGFATLWASPIAGIFLSVLAVAATGRILCFGGLLVAAGFALVAL
jgi:hypothetical protein